jgi:hypothetical protein
MVGRVGVVIARGFVVVHATMQTCPRPIPVEFGTGSLHHHGLVDRPTNFHHPIRSDGKVEHNGRPITFFRPPNGNQFLDRRKFVAPSFLVMLVLGSMVANTVRQAPAEFRLEIVATAQDKAGALDPYLGRDES